MFFRTLILSCIVLFTIKAKAQVNTYDQLPANLKNGLVAYYPFNNSVNDIGTNGYNGTIQSGSVPYVADRFGNTSSAVQLGGGYITTSTSVFNYQRNENFSISIWFSSESSSNSSGRLLSNECPEGNFRIAAYNDGGYIIAFGDYIVDTVQLNSWNHLVYTYNNRDEKVYINGQLKYSNNDIVTEALNYCAPLTIGAKASSAFDRWVGKADDLAVYNRALANVEVTQLYTVSSTGVIDSGITCSSVVFNPFQDTLTNTLDSVVLDAGSGFANYLWNTGDTTQKIIVNESGLYHVSVTNNLNCSYTDSVLVSFINLSISASDTVICSNQEVQLTGSFVGIETNSGLNANLKWSKLIDGSQFVGAEVNFQHSIFDPYSSKLYSILKSNTVNRYYQFDLNNNQVTSLPSLNAPGELYAPAFDFTNNRIIATRSGRDAVYSLPLEGGSWTSIGTGGFDAESYGGAPFWNPVTSRFGYFGGYGFFAMKNWVWENNGSNGWLNVYANNNNCEPAKRNTQIARNADGKKLYFFSGQGSCDGNQFASSCSVSQPWGTDVGVYCWLKDLWELDLTTYSFTNLLPVNHASILKEGSFAYDFDLGNFYNIGGYVPSPTWNPSIGSQVNFTNEIYRYKPGSNSGFESINVGGTPPPEILLNQYAGRTYYDSKYKRIIWARNDGVWALSSDSTARSISYLWSTGDTSSTITVRPRETTTYTLTVNVGDSSYTKQFTVTVEANEGNFNPFSERIINSFDTVVLDAGAGYGSYNWNIGNTSQEVQITESGRYNVTVEDQIGCQYTDTVFVNLYKFNSLFTDTTVSSGIKLDIHISSNNSIIKPGAGVYDQSGNYYPSVIINGTEWMGSNLRTTRFANGDSIPNISSLSPFSTEFINFLTAGYSMYDALPENASLYGHLYNLYTIYDSRGVCPTGWSLPSLSDWNKLMLIADKEVDTTQPNLQGRPGLKLKTNDFELWHPSDNGATNQLGISAVPGGRRNYDGNYVAKGESAYLWSSTYQGAIGSNYLIALSNNAEGERGYINSFAQIYSYDPKDANSIRCIRSVTDSNAIKYEWSNGDSTSSISIYPFTSQTLTSIVTVGSISDTLAVRINVNPRTYSLERRSVKVSDFPISWNGLEIQGQGTYKYTTQNSFGSDSTAILEVALLPQIAYDSVYRFTLNQSIDTISPVSIGSKVIGRYGLVSTIAGTGQIGYNNGNNLSAQFNHPNDIEIDKNGNIFIADKYNHVIRKISSDGIVSTLAGSGINTRADGLGEQAAFSMPTGIAIDSIGNILVADRVPNSIRKITPIGLVTTLAGEGNFGADDGYGQRAKFTYPYDVALDPLGNIYVADEFNHLIRKIDSTNYVSTVAGTGVYGSQDGFGSGASVTWPNGMALGNNGKLLFIDYGNQKLRSISQFGQVETIAGSGEIGLLDSTSLLSKFYSPGDVAQDNAGNIFITDRDNHVVRKIDLSGNVSTFSGSGVAGYVNGFNDSAKYNYPTGIAIDSLGSILITDQLNHVIRKVERGFRITPALPEGLSIDSFGKIIGIPKVASPETMYTVIAENTHGSDTATFSLSVLDCDIPDFNPFSDTTSLCGTSIELNAGNSYLNYLWNNSATTNSITALSSGWYSVTVTNENGCSAIDSTYLSLFKADIIQSDTTICLGTDKTLSLNILPDYFGFYTDKASHDATFNGLFYSENFNLYNGDLNAGNNGPSPLVPLDFPDQNSYSFAAFANPNGLFVFNRTVLNIPNDQHTIQLSTKVTLDDLELSFNGAPVYTLSGYFSITDFDHSPMSLGKIVEFNQGQLTPTTSNDVAIIVTLENGAVYNYKANASGEYIGFTSSVPIANVTVRSAVFINGIQNVGFATIDDLKFGSIVPTSSVNYNQLTPGYSILWSTSDTSSSIVVSPLVSTQYKVTVTDGITTCSDSITITVPVIDNSLISLDTTAICAGSSARLQAGVATSYVWLKNGVVINGASSRIYTATSAGNYRVVVTNATGCSDTSAVVTITERPVPESGSISGGGVSVCSGTNRTTLSLSSAVGTIRWQSSLDSLVFTDIANETGNGYTATNLSATTYYRVIATNSCGSDTSSVVKITVNLRPVARFSVDNASQQLRANLFVFTNISTPSIGVSYYWDFDNGFFSNLKNPSYGYRTAGTYQVKLKVTTAASCVDSTSLSVEVREAPIALNDQFSTAHATLLSGNVASNDTPSPDGGNVWSLVGTNGGSLGGTASMTSAGTLTYTPRLGYAGTDTLTYQVCDSNGDCVQAKVSILVAAAPTPPPPPPPPAAGNLYVAGTTCAQFNGRTASALTQLCYTVKTTPGSRSKPAVTSVSAVTPTSFMYYVRVTAPSASFTVNIGQTVSQTGFKLFTVNTGGSVASGDNCVRVASVTTPSTGQARVSITKATVGRTYIIGVRYDTKSLVGYVTNGTLTANYTFSAKIGTQTLANSTSSVTLYPNNCAGVQPTIISSRMPDSKEIIGKNNNTTNSTNTSTKSLSITNLSLKVYPNPTSHYFNVVVEGGAPQIDGVLRVMNMVGQLIEEKKQVKPGQLIQLGHQYINGMYLIEYSQGSDRATLKVNKY